MVLVPYLVPVVLINYQVWFLPLPEIRRTVRIGTNTIAFQIKFGCVHSVEHPSVSITLLVVLPGVASSSLPLLAPQREELSSHF